VIIIIEPQVTAQSFSKAKYTVRMTAPAGEENHVDKDVRNQLTDAVSVSSSEYNRHCIHFFFLLPGHAPC